jgi:predicted outer membrane protein
MKSLMQSIGMLVLALGISIVSLAQDAKIMNGKDAKFTSDILSADNYTTWLLEIVPEKAQSEELKKIAQEMLPEHTNMRNQIQAYAESRGYGMNSDKIEKYTAKRAKWETKRGGKEWDADIMEELVDMHKDAIDMLEDAQKDVKDQELKQWIVEVLLKWQNHYAMLEPMKEQVKKPWKKDSAKDKKEK